LAGGSTSVIDAMPSVTVDVIFVYGTVGPVPGRDGHASGVPLPPTW
jgi:hypothetical protein